MSKANIFEKLFAEIGNPYGVIGAMCNIKAESNFSSINMQNSYESKLGFTDNSYTNAVDNGTYQGFTTDRVGYGLCQWTSSGRKTGLLAYATALGVSIGNEDMQIEYLIRELKTSYQTVLEGLKNATSIKEASDLFMIKFERPADQSEAAKTRRASVGPDLWNELVKEGEKMNKIIIALDNGHGLNTAGKRSPFIVSIGREIHEWEFNRPVVIMMAAMINQYDELEALEVSPTEDDTPLQDRVDLANEMGAKLFHSTHANGYDGSFEGKNPKGISVHYYPNSVEGEKIARILLNQLVQGTEQENRGIVASNFFVLRETEMAAVLSENLFMDNPEEALLMLDPNFQREVAIEHVKGFCEYLGVTYRPEFEPRLEGEDDPEVDVEKTEIYCVQLNEEYTDRNTASEAMYRIRQAGFSAKLIKIIE